MSYVFLQLWYKNCDLSLSVLRRCPISYQTKYTVFRVKRRYKKYIKDSIFRHIFARGHHPQTIEMFERFNESLKYERIYRREYRDPLEAAKDQEEYRIKYNTFRPNEALGYRVSASVFTLKNFTGAFLNTH